MDSDTKVIQNIVVPEVLQKRSLVWCKVCNKHKVKMNSGIRRGTTKQWRYVDERNRHWSGKSCPSCTTSRSMVYYRASKVKERQNYVKRDIRLDRSTGRMCRECNKPLPPECYFKHAKCRPITEYWDMGERYGSYVTRT
jgi:hypothetical protein